MIYVPNGAMSSGVITNYSKLDTRRNRMEFWRGLRRRL